MSNKSDKIIKSNLEIILLKEFEYSSSIRCCDKTSYANISFILNDLYKHLYETSLEFKLHVKSYMREIVQPGCITIPEFLTSYLIHDNKHNFVLNFPTIYLLLTSFNEIFLYPTSTST